jgi:hypothetical protein
METITNKTMLFKGKLNVSKGGGYIFLWRPLVVDGQVTDARQHIATISKDKMTWSECEDMAKRISDCVNAFEGIEDPAAFMEYHKNVHTAYNKIQSEFIALGKKSIITTDNQPIKTNLKPTNNL